MPSFLYSISFKLSNFHKYTHFFLGIMLGGLLIPLNYVVLLSIFGKKVAFFSSILLIFSSQYIEQCLEFNTVLPGIIFLILALVLLIDCYTGRDNQWWKLWFSGLLLNCAVMCRLENALLIPFFVLYDVMFDKKNILFVKTTYWFICISYIFTIVLISFIDTGNPFILIVQHHNLALEAQNAQVLPFVGAFGQLKDLFCMLAPWSLWILAIGGGALVVRRYRSKACVFFSALSIFLGFFLIKIKMGTVDFYLSYYFLYLLIGIPLALECIRSIEGKFVRGMFVNMLIIVSLLTWIKGFHFNVMNPIGLKNNPFYGKVAFIIKDLKGVSTEIPLCIAQDYPMNQSILYYLGKDFFPDEDKEQRDREKGSFFLLLTDRNDIQRRVKNREWMLVREYGEGGLFKIDALQ
ncbi:MAG: glycosyltransferase family 39 protein [Candidatus Omnitrophica bacterium]|nr:glycosyltransferase family 39 protein [Candidatus Omnitrophota bacterium]